MHMEAVCYFLPSSTSVKHANHQVPLPRCQFWHRFCENTCSHTISVNYETTDVNESNYTLLVWLSNSHHAQKMLHVIMSFCRLSLLGNNNSYSYQSRWSSSYIPIVSQLIAGCNLTKLNCVHCYHAHFFDQYTLK